MAAAAVILGAFSAYGQQAQGQSTYDALNTQANLQEQNAEEALAQGQAQATRQQLTADKKIGTSVAAYAASGVQSNSGSVLEVLRNSAQNSELDRLNILHGADLKAINYRNQAALDRFGGKSALAGAQWSALGSLTAGGIKSYSAATAGGSNAGKDNSGMGSDDYEGAGLE